MSGGPAAPRLWAEDAPHGDPSTVGGQPGAFLRLAQRLHPLGFVGEFDEPVPCIERSVPRKVCKGSQRDLAVATGGGQSAYLFEQGRANALPTMLGNHGDLFEVCSALEVEQLGEPHRRVARHQEDAGLGRPFGAGRRGARTPPDEDDGKQRIGFVLDPGEQRQVAILRRADVHRQARVGLTSASRPSRPLTNFGESSVDRLLASSTASAIATFTGTSVA